MSDTKESQQSLVSLVCGIERLPIKVVLEAEVTESGCWVLPGKAGRYTSYHFKRADLKWSNLTLHRVSFSVYRGLVLSGQEIDHLCFVKGCFNPSHLEQVSPEENKKRYYDSDKFKASFTECPHGLMRKYLCEACLKDISEKSVQKRASRDVAWALENAEELEVSSGEEEDWLLLERKAASLTPGLPPGGIKRVPRGILFHPRYPTSNL